MLLAAFLLFFLSFQRARATEVVDDASERVQYSPIQLRSCAEPQDCFGAWFLDARSVSSGSTLHVTGGPGTSLDFQFTGTNLSVFGATLPNGASALISVDAGGPTRISTASSIAHFQTRLFASALLPFGAHTLRIQYDGDAARGELLGVDFFQIDTVQAVPPAPSPTATTTATASATATSTSSASSPSVSTTGDAAPSSSGRLSPAAAAAIGFGCALAAILVLLALWTLCRWRVLARQNRTGAGPVTSWWDFRTTQRESRSTRSDVPPASAAWANARSQLATGQSAPLPSSSGRMHDSPVARWASSVHSSRMASNPRTAPRVVAYTAPEQPRAREVLIE